MDAEARWAGSWVGLVFAGFWGLALVIAAVTVPVYSSGGTLTEVNGDGILAVVAIPLLVTVGVALALRHRYRTGRRGPGVVAPMLTGLVLIFCVLGMLTIGVFVLPVAIALVVACALAS